MLEKGWPEEVVTSAFSARKPAVSARGLDFLGKGE
jgi:hypothetical protein